MRIPHPIVIPVKTGIQRGQSCPQEDLFRAVDTAHWIPACAGMTGCLGQGPKPSAVIASGETARQSRAGCTKPGGLLSFAPSGRRWREAPDEGLRMRQNSRAKPLTPTLSPKGRGSKRAPPSSLLPPPCGEGKGGGRPKG